MEMCESPDIDPDSTPSQICELKSSIAEPTESADTEMRFAITVASPERMHL